MNKEFLITILKIGKKLFPVVLLAYLVLFLLEVSFPGFVSNSFNLNWVLGGVLVLGVLVAVAPEEQEGPEIIEKPKKSDYWLFIGLGLISGVLMYFKSDLGFWWRLSLAIISALLITGFCLGLMLMDDQEKTIDEKLSKANAKKSAKNYLMAVKKVFLRPVSLPAGAVVIIVVLLGLSLIKTNKQLEVKITETQEIAEETEENIKEPANAGSNCW